jgi:predicted PurR-regulated permease PerM
MLGPLSDKFVPVARRVLLAILLIVLALMCMAILRPFVTPILWAAILSYSAWPLFHALRGWLHGLQTPAALLATLIIALAVVVPVLWMLALVQLELIQAYQLIAHYLAERPHSVPAWMVRIPWLGARVQELLADYDANPPELAQQLSNWVVRETSRLGTIIGGVGRNLLKLLLTLLIMFFCFRDGEAIGEQARRVVTELFGERLNPYLHTAGRMTRALVYGTIVTAFAQGVVAGIGYWLFGMPAPVLLALLTGAASMLPLVGTGIVWIPAAIWLMSSGHVLKGVLLLLWGALLVLSIDNVLRPILVSSATRVPFLLVLLGALGGVQAFGLLGLFVGPVLLGIAMAIWREWTAAASGAKLV